MSYDIDGDDIEGDVMGDVMGDDDVVGIVRRNPRTGRKSVVKVPSRSLALPAKPSWRKGQIAPGVNGPQEGYVPLPMSPQAGNGIFTASLNQITFSGQLQKPFMPKRLLVSTVRTGTSAIGRCLGVFYVGTDLQQAEIAGWDIELVGQATSFDTSLGCNQAEPGVLIRMVVNLSTVLTSTDTIQLNMMLLGNIVH
jgi:hypothetical protein